MSIDILYCLNQPVIADSNIFKSIILKSCVFGELFFLHYHNCPRGVAVEQIFFIVFRKPYVPELTVTMNYFNGLR